MLDGRQPCRHPDVDHYGPAISVDAINTAGVSAGPSRVVWRRFASSIPLFPQFNEISELGSIPGSSTEKMLVRATFRTSGSDRVVLAVIDQVACRSGRARLFLDHARVALSSGHVFGTGGAGHVRLNFANSRAIRSRPYREWVGRSPTS